MLLKIFSIYDDKARAYLPPFFLPTTAMAIRAFTECANSDSHQFGKSPADYTLFELGQFNDQNGHIETTAHHKNLGTALNFKHTPLEELTSISFDDYKSAGGTA